MCRKNAYIIVTAGDKPRLGQLEVLRLLERHGVRIIVKDISFKVMRLVADISPNSMKEILYNSALVQMVLREICSVDLGPPYVRMEACPWDELRRKTFRIDVVKIGGRPRIKTADLIRALGDAISRATDGSAKVSLTRPDLRIMAIVYGQRLYIGALVKKFRRDRFRWRSPERRPFFLPTSLTPEIARLLVNISLENSFDKVFLDPLCGAGSMLIEAADEGLFSVGCDIKLEYLRGAKKNSRFFSLDGLIDFVNCDSFMLPLRSRSVDAAATDLPYGRLSRTYLHGLPELTGKMLTDMAEILKKGRTIVVMHSKDSRKEIVGIVTKIGNLKIESEYEIYVHGSLVRSILVIRNGC